MEQNKVRDVDLQKNVYGHLDSALALDMQKIPSKMSFKIGEVARLLNVKVHVLRYWALEFESLKPHKMPNGQRIYLRKDVQMALLIKKLLYTDGFSVKGAKKALLALEHKNQRVEGPKELKEPGPAHLLSQQEALKKVVRMQKIITKIQNLLK